MITSLRYVIFKVRWGYFGLLGDENGVLRSCLPVRSYRTAKIYLLVGIIGAKYDSKLFIGLQEQVKGYFEGGCVEFGGSIGVVLDDLSDFSRDILTACRKIGYGRRVSYGQLAELAGRAGAGRAVGTVLGKNRCPLLVPCHRIIRGDGKIGGFSAIGGVKMKKRMLELEQTGRI